MDGQAYFLAAAIALLLCTAMAVLWRPLVTTWRETRLARVRRDFHRQRERLEAKFVQLGSVAFRPHAPQWVDCRFDDDVAYVRDRASGELSALVAVTVFLPPEDEPYLTADEDPPGEPRDATAVFRFDGHHWETEGRALFNVSPAEAIDLYRQDMEIVAHEVAHRVA